MQVVRRPGKAMGRALLGWEGGDLNHSLPVAGVSGAARTS